MIEIELPYPPSVNHYWRHVGPRVLISREGRTFRNCVCSLLAQASVRSLASPLSGPLEIQIDVYPPDNRRRDLDNLQKSLLDALQHGGVYFDDSQIVRILIEKRECVADGKVVVRIEERRSP